GVLQRLRGTPLGPGMYLVGRTASALWIALLTGALVLSVGLIFFDLEVAGFGVPLAVAVMLLGTGTSAACGFALAAVLPSSKAISAAGLAILLPLSFFSDVFVVGDIPAWMDTVGSVFPLKHFANSLASALDPAGPSVNGVALAVQAAWLAGAGVFAVRSFRWDRRN
ncbi:MAG: ABC transporter permease, partial [Rhodococcus sp. (in: high G+C Gram-positive bacteria)]|uniref:ABC transporter permease n=1 Tax=Rhodococcus sp. TaxID=1831 RepID=UPI003BAED9EE